MNNENKIIPFIKWAGGKRWFVQHYGHILPKSFKRYIEPFLGGGSVYFHLLPKQAILGDSNPELISAYQGIKTDYTALNELLAKHKNNHSFQYYYEIRASKPSGLIERAARFIYLNRTCFNGIYRVNKQGNFNVPVGTRDSVIRETDDFQKISGILKDSVIETVDFEELIDLSTEGDLIFADPPYTVRHNLNGFNKYNEKLFSWDDQIRLADSLLRARERGVQIVATNANHESVRNLYSDRSFEFEIASRYSSISSKASSRNQFEELVVRS